MVDPVAGYGKHREANVGSLSKIECHFLTGELSLEMMSDVETVDGDHRSHNLITLRPIMMPRIITKMMNCPKTIPGLPFHASAESHHKEKAEQKISPAPL